MNLQPHFRRPLTDKHVKHSTTSQIVQYIIKDLSDRELGRANDARSAWALIEAEWPEAVAISLDGTRARGWMMLTTLLEKAGEAVIVRFNHQVGGVTIKEK